MRAKILEKWIGDIKRQIDLAPSDFLESLLGEIESINDGDSRYCNKCESVKNLDCFGIDRTKSTGRCYICKVCKNNHRLAWKNKGRESLSDPYIKSLLTNHNKLTSAIIPPSLIECKRLTVLLKELC